MAELHFKALENLSLLTKDDKNRFKVVAENDKIIKEVLVTENISFYVRLSTELKKKKWFKKLFWEKSC